MHFPLELVDLICNRIKPEFLYKCNIFPKLNRKRIEKYWKKIGIFKLIEKNDLQGVRYLFSFFKENEYFISNVFNYACKCGNLTIIKYLMSKKVNVTGRSVMSSIRYGHFLLFKYLISNNGTIENGEKALIKATIIGDLKMIKYIISLGYKPITCEPLIVACKKGLLQILKYYISLKIDIESINFLHPACFSGNLKLVKYLYKNYNYSIDENCLLEASASRNVEIVKFLEKRKKYLKKDYDSALQYSISCQANLEMIIYLISKGSNYLSLNSLMLNACLNGNSKTVKYLISLGADPRYKNNLPIIYATKSQSVKLVKYLVSLGGNINAQNDESVVCAIKNNDVEMSMYLLSRGANPCAQDNKPIIYASKRGNLQMVKYLVSLGANPFTHNNDPITIAYYRDHKNVLEYLQTLGAEIQI
jgi:ankyrin repeat protein